MRIPEKPQEKKKTPFEALFSSEALAKGVVKDPRLGTSKVARDIPRGRSPIHDAMRDDPGTLVGAMQKFRETHPRADKAAEAQYKKALLARLKGIPSDSKGHYRFENQKIPDLTQFQPTSLMGEIGAVAKTMREPGHGLPTRAEINTVAKQGENVAETVAGVLGGYLKGNVEGSSLAQIMGGGAGAGGGMVAAMPWETAKNAMTTVSGDPSVGLGERAGAAALTYLDAGAPGTGRVLKGAWNAGKGLLKSKAVTKTVVEGVEAVLAEVSPKPLGTIKTGSINPKTPPVKVPEVPVVETPKPVKPLGTTRTGSVNPKTPPVKPVETPKVEAPVPAQNVKPTTPIAPKMEGISADITKLSEAELDALEAKLEVAVQQQKTLAKAGEAQGPGAWRSDVDPGVDWKDLENLRAWRKGEWKPPEEGNPFFSSKVTEKGTNQYGEATLKPTGEYIVKGPGALKGATGPDGNVLKFSSKAEADAYAETLWGKPKTPVTAQNVKPVEPVGKGKGSVETPKPVKPKDDVGAAATFVGKEDGKRNMGGLLKEGFGPSEPVSVRNLTTGELKPGEGRQLKGGLFEGLRLYVVKDGDAYRIIEGGTGEILGGAHTRTLAVDGIRDGIKRMGGAKAYADRVTELHLKTQARRIEKQPVTGKPVKPKVEAGTGTTPKPVSGAKEVEVVPRQPVPASKQEINVPRGFGRPSRVAPIVERTDTHVIVRYGDTGAFDVLPNDTRRIASGAKHHNGPFSTLDDARAAAKSVDSPQSKPSTAPKAKPSEKLPLEATETPASKPPKVEVTAEQGTPEWRKQVAERAKLARERIANPLDTEGHVNIGSGGDTEHFTDHAWAALDDVLNAGDDVVKGLENFRKGAGKALSEADFEKAADDVRKLMLAGGQASRAGGQATGLANQEQARQAVAGIIDEVESAGGKGADHWQEVGKKSLNESADPKGAASALAEDVASGKVELTGENVGKLLEGDRHHSNTVNEAAKRLDEAIKNGGETGPLKKAYQDALDARQTYLDNIQVGKGRWSDVGRALQAGSDLDTGNFADVIARATRSKGSALTEKEADAFKKIVDQLGVDSPEGVPAKLREIQEELAKLRMAENQPKPVKGAARFDKKVLDDELDALTKQLVQMSGKASALVDPSLYPVIGKIALNYAKRGINTLDELVEATIAHLKKQGIDADRQDVVDAMSPQSAKATKSELEQQIAKLKAEARKESTGGKQKALDAEAKAIADTKAKIADLEEQIATGNFKGQNAGKPRTELQKELDKLRREANAKSPEGVAKRAADTDAKIAELERKLKEKDFRVPTKREVQLTRQAEALKGREWLLKKELNSLIKDAGRSPLEKQIDKVLDVWGVGRTFKSSFDVSFMGVQGFPALIVEPQAWRQAWAPMLKALKTQGYERTVGELAKREDVIQWLRAGAEFPAIKGSGEEFFISDLAGRLPPIKASNQAYDVGATMTRLKMMNNMRDALEEGAEKLTLDQMKVIADYANTFTGRGAFLKGAQTQAKATGAVFYAARYAASLFETAAGRPLLNAAIQASKSGDTRVLKAIAKKYARLYGVVAAWLPAAHVALKPAGYDVKLSPRHTDFGRAVKKLPNGDTATLDLIPAVIQQPLRVLSQLTTGRVSAADKEEGGFKARATTMESLLETKASPGLGVGLGLLDGEKFGEKYNLNTAEGIGNVAKGLFAPISMENAYDLATSELSPLEKLIFLSLAPLGGGNLRKGGVKKAPKSEADKIVDSVMKDATKGADPDAIIKKAGG